MTTWTVFERPLQRCRACQCFRLSQIHALGGEGPDGEVDLALVGEGPGADEEAYGRNFIGRAGEMLDGCLAEVGILRSGIWICNTVRCRPVHPQTFRNRKPTAHEVDCCRGYTVDELKIKRPKVIVAMGDTAAVALLGDRLVGGITENRGKVIWSEEWQAWIVCAFHPAYPLYNPAQREFLVADLRLAKRIVDDGDFLQAPPTEVEVVWDMDRAYEVRDEILAASRFTFDWETRGVHLTKALGLCVSIAIRPRHAFVFPRFKQGWIPAWRRSHLQHLDREVLVPIFTSDAEKGGWHVAFDNNITRTTLGVWPTNVQFCGLIGHHLINNHLGQRAHGLKVCAAMYTDMGRYDDPLDQWLIANHHTVDGKPDMGKVWMAPDALVHQYNGCDADAPFRMWPDFIAKMIEVGVHDTFVHERMPICLDQQERDRIGVRIDVPYLDRLSADLAQGKLNLEAEIAESIGPELAATFKGAVVNPNSHKQVAKLLYEELDLPILGRTETDQPSTKEEYLIQLKDMHPSIEMILRHRAYTKIKGTWVDGSGKRGEKKALRAVLDEDGTARMDTRVAGTETFRFITTRPFAYLTFPKNRRGMPSVRALIIARDGYLLLSRDFVQQEFAIQAIHAQQWDLVEAMLDRGEDIHEKVTADLGGVTKAEYLLNTIHVQDSDWPVADLVAAGWNILDLVPDAYEQDGHWWLSKGDYDEFKGHRSKFKSINFMILFRGGARKLARMALGCRHNRAVEMCGCEAEAAQYISLYFERYDRIRWWQYAIIKELRETGMVREPYGTYRKLPGILDSNKWAQLEAERQACNYPIQRGGAAKMLKALLVCSAAFAGKLPLRAPFPGRVAFTVHDQLVAEVREDLADEGDDILKRHMEAPDPILGGRSLRTDGSRGHCWS